MNGSHRRWWSVGLVALGVVLGACSGRSHGRSKGAPGASEHRGPAAARPSEPTAGAPAMEPPPVPPAAVVSDPSLADLPPEGASPEELLRGLDDPEAIERQAASASPPAEAEAEAPCALHGAPQRLWPAPGMSAVAWDGRWLWVAVLAVTEHREEESFVLLRVRPGRRPQPWVRQRMPARAIRSTPPALAAAPEGVWAVFVDRKGQVQRALVPSGSPPARLDWTAVAAGADPRFAPALFVSEGRRWLAWSGGGDDAGVWFLSFGPDGKAGAPRRLHADAGAGALPRWEAVEPPVLYFVDPRRSISVLWRARMKAEGAASPPEVVRPLSHLYEPPALALAAGFVGYRALALDARTALVAADLRAPSDAPLRRLAPAEGYAKLRIVGATMSERTALFVFEEPRARRPRAPRHLAVRLVARSGKAGKGAKASPALRLHGPDGRLEAPAVAALGAGRAAVVAGGPSAVTLYRLRCTLPEGSGTEDAAAPSSARARTSS